MMSADNNGNGGNGGNGGSSGSSGMAFVVGLFFGTLVGVTTAIFIAPASGRELRENLSRGAKRLVAQATDLVPDEWTEIAEEEITKEIMANVSSLRAAGL